MRHWRLSASLFYIAQWTRVVGSCFLNTARQTYSVVFWAVFHDTTVQWVSSPIVTSGGVVQCVHLDSKLIKRTVNYALLKRLFLMYVSMLSLSHHCLYLMLLLLHLLSCFVDAIIVSPPALPIFVSSFHFLSPCLVRSNSICSRTPDTPHKLVD